MGGIGHRKAKVRIELLLHGRKIALGIMNQLKKSTSMKKLIPLSFLLVVSLSGIKQVYAQTVDPTFAPIELMQSGLIYNAIQQPDGKYLVAGGFTQVNGSPATGLARLNADGTLDEAFTTTVACKGSVVRMRVLTDGQILLQNQWGISVGGRTFSSLAKLNADGTLAADFTPGSGPMQAGYAGPVAAMTVQPDGKILLGGLFSSYDGVAANSLVRLNANGSVDQTFTTALNKGFVDSYGRAADVQGVVIQPDGKVLVCGTFENYNNTGRSGLVRLNSDGSLDVSFNPASIGKRVQAVALDSRTNAVVIHTSDGTQQIVRLTSTGQVDNSFNPFGGSNCFYLDYQNDEELAVDASGRVILSGCFADFGGTSGNSYVTRLLPDGQLDAQFAIGKQLNGRVHSVKILANGEILLGGHFSRYGSLRNVNLVRVNDKAELISTFHPAIMQPGQLDEVVQQADGKIIVGGQFWKINGQDAGNLARLNTDGTLDQSFQLAGVNGEVRRIALSSDGRIMVGGEFTSAGTHASPLVARLLTNGSADASFTVLTSAITSTDRENVSALALQSDGSILVGGSSKNIGGYTSALHHLLANGSVDAAYANELENKVRLDIKHIVALPNNQYIINRTDNPTVDIGLTRLNADGSFDNSYVVDPTVYGPLYLDKLLLLPDGKLLVSGDFRKANSGENFSLVRLNSDGSVDNSYALPKIEGLISQLARYPNGQVLVAGTFGYVMVDGKDRGSLIRLNADGSYDASFADVLVGSATGLALQPDGAILLGGYSFKINGQNRGPLVRLVSSSVLAVSSHRAIDHTQAWPNPAHESLQVSLDAAAKPTHLALLDGLGKTIISHAVTKTDLALPVQNLPAGVYLLRVDYADGPVTRRVVVQ
ncbi:hypothetical protein BXP70_21400 [Hymenobacter crusticola]|uniref:Secretion system C-terminal sorting domain-containing protein n=1 Tax=Hymenobacter crusticola TaxID=1770526 RepID=A0A243W8J1_9BACT|nr:hypothetical protein BXP70_21400 [Hymenobacter crusticola]